MHYDNMVSCLKRGQCQIWVAGQNKKILACLITEIVQYFGCKALDIRLCCGQDRYLWQSYMKELEEYAIQQGCSKMEAIARKGWTRFLKDWENKLVFIEKDLTHGKLTKTTDSNN